MVKRSLSSGEQITLKEVFREQIEVSHANPWHERTCSINVQSNTPDLSVRGILVARARRKLATLECLCMARQITSISDLLSSASLRYSPAVPFRTRSRNVLISRQTRRRSNSDNGEFWLIDRI